MTALDLALPAVAALWGATAGALLPRAAYRFSAPAGEEWRTACPAGHPVRGWLGREVCARCARGADPQNACGVPSDGVAAGGARALPADGGTAPPAHGTDSAAPASEPVEASAPAPDGGDAAADGEDGRPEPPAPAPRASFLGLATALVCAALALATGTRPELAVWLLLAPVAVLLARVDFRVQRLPDPLTLPFAAASLALLGVVALLPEHAGDWLTSLYAALALGGGYFVLFLVNPGGMGFGDVKLALGTGAVLGWYGWPTVLLGTFAGFLFGALYGGALVVARRAGRKTAIAFGPFLIAGAFAGVLVGAYTA
ncbi:prepilin peptidase [Streptomyces sp. NBC_00631]|uniref:prepilin peptidase n=1 Tax=Streptomyces sp. NBC_00631 TaxID=2975793 RepID=UPI0030E08189